MKVRNVREMSKLNIQMKAVVTAKQADLHQRGKSSEFIVHGIGPMPAPKKRRYAHMPKRVSQE